MRELLSTTGFGTEEFKNLDLETVVRAIQSLRRRRHEHWSSFLGRSTGVSGNVKGQSVLPPPREALMNRGDDEEEGSGMHVAGLASSQDGENMS